MTEFPLDIVTPDGKIFSGRAESLRLRSIEGDLCRLCHGAGHGPRRGHHRWE